MPTSSSVRRWLPLALVAGLALSGCGTKVAGGSGAGASGDLPVLHVGQRLGAPDTVGSGRDTDPYPLVGTLPSGPSSAPVYRYADARTDESVAAALAAAFHVSGTPERHAHGWVVTAKDATVAVTDGDATWSYSVALNGCLGMPVDVDNAPGTSSAVGCATEAVPPSSAPAPNASGGSGGSAAPADLSDARALALASPEIAALGLDAAAAHVQPGAGPVRWVTWDPSVGGVSTSGTGTTLVVDATGVVSGQGVRAEPTEGPAYPIISASAALDWLRAMPQPEIAIACAIGQTCPGVGPKKVTGATLGLTTAYDGSSRVLVPAWLFRIEGTDQPVPVVAVESAYLADPATAGGASSEPGSSGGSAGGDPGTSFTPIPPGTPQPEPISGSGAGHSLTVLSVTLGKDGRTLVLHSQGGVCEDVAATVDETPAEVRVSLTATWNKGANVACPAIAKDISVPVTLTAPWNDRTIIDASTGENVPVG